MVSIRLTDITTRWICILPLECFLPKDWWRRISFLSAKLLSLSPPFPFNMKQKNFSCCIMSNLENPKGNVLDFVVSVLFWLGFCRPDFNWFHEGKVANIWLHRNLINPRLFLQYFLWWLFHARDSGQSKSVFPSHANELFIPILSKCRGENEQISIAETWLVEHTGESGKCYCLLSHQFNQHSNNMAHNPSQRDVGSNLTTETWI